MHVYLPHWGRVTHICVSKLTIIGSDNGLSPGRRQAIIWTNAGILLIGPSGTNFSEISIKIHIFSFKKMQLKMSSGKWQPFCLGLNVLMTPIQNSGVITHPCPILKMQPCNRWSLEWIHKDKNTANKMHVFPFSKTSTNLNGLHRKWQS